VHLSRPGNLLIAFVAFSLGTWLSRDRRLIFVENENFWYASICIAAIMATGYWINDVFDFRIDRINKPGRVIISRHLSTKKVTTAYISAIFCISVFALFLLGWKLTLFHLSIISILFVYAWVLKRMSVVGNILIASLTSAVIAYPVLLSGEINLPLIWMIVFAFGITYIREVMKDLEDIRGDLEFGLQTMPIRIGISATRRVVAVCYGLFGISHLLPVLEEFIRLGEFNLTYLIISILAIQCPVIYLFYRIATKKSAGEYGLQSAWLKWLIAGGMFSVIFLN